MSRGSEGFTRTLVLLRHALAVSSAPSDHARELSERGRRAAAEVGTWLTQIGVAPDLALVSDAARTVQTWEEASLAAGWNVAPERSAALYAAGPEALLDLVREVDPAVASLVVVGHNPTMAYLAEMLDDGAGDDDAITGLVSAGYPPGSATVFAVRGEWSELSSDGATVTGFHVGDPDRPSG